MGYYGGFVASIASMGISEGAEWAPLLTLSVGGAAVGVAVGLFDDRRAFAARSFAGLGLGLVAGLACWAVDPDLEWCVGTLAVLSQLMAWWSWAAPPP